MVAASHLHRGRTKNIARSLDWETKNRNRFKPNKFSCMHRYRIFFLFQCNLDVFNKKSKCKKSWKYENAEVVLGITKISTT